MAKKNRTKQRDALSSGASAPGEVGPRQPCPCGSGKRYKACHGAPGGADVYVARPFDGLAGECDLVALRELVPAATAPLSLVGEAAELAGDRTVTACTLLPGASPAMVRDSGDVWLGLQVQHGFGDPSRDLAAVLLAALAAEPGVVGLTSPPGPGPRLQDLLADEPLAVTVHDGFDYWLADVDESERAGMSEVLADANDAVAPTARLASVEAAYWTRMGAKEHLRWVRPEPEDQLLTALARLHAAGRDTLVEGGRLVGMFRAHGLLTPVWDLAVGTGPEALEDAVVDLGAALDEALARTADQTADLTAEERSAREGLATRQVTIR